MMIAMEIDNETLMEIINEEDFQDSTLFERVAGRVFSIRDPEIIRMFLKKLRFSFLSSDESFRMQTIRRLTNLFAGFTPDEFVAICFDSLVGNYVVVSVLSKEYPVVSIESVKKIIEVVPRLAHTQDVFLFGFPYKEQVILELDERVRNLEQDEIQKLISACKFLFGIDYFHKSRETVESYRNLFSAVDDPLYNLRAQAISSLLNRDFEQFSLAMRRFGFDISSSNEVISKYYELWDALDRLSMPTYFDIRNLRFNRVLFNGNFYFLRYMDFAGKEQMLFPFSQVDLSDVSRVYDPIARMFYTPRERYGRLLLGDIFSFREFSKVNEPDRESLEAVAAMSEDDIERGIRRILKDANVTAHSPVEIADVLTQNLFVNNPDDLRLSGFIIKGASFGVVHLNTIAGQILKVAHAPIKMVFLVHIPTIDDHALRYFIQEFESRQKNYCILDRRDITRLFLAYEILSR